MILSFLEGLVLGFGAAVPLGPINILIMNEAIKRYKNGVAIAHILKIDYMNNILSIIHNPKVITSLNMSRIVCYFTKNKKY